MTISQSTASRSNDDYCYRPIVSVADLPESSFPTVMIPDRKYQPLCDTGARRAMNSFGTIDRHERGALGEGAFEQLLGLENAVDTELYEYGDPGYDFDLSIGTVDVKTARPRWDQPSLMVGASKELAADYYVLIHQLSQRCYRVLGYAPAAVVAQAPVRQIRVHERAGCGMCRRTGCGRLRRTWWKRSGHSCSHYIISIPSFLLLNHD